MTVLASFDPVDGGLQDDGPWDFSGNFSETIGDLYFLTPDFGSTEMDVFFGVQDLEIDLDLSTNGRIAYSFTTSPG